MQADDPGSEATPRAGPPGAPVGPDAALAFLEQALTLWEGEAGAAPARAQKLAAIEAALLAHPALADGAYGPATEPALAGLERLRVLAERHAPELVPALKDATARRVEAALAGWEAAALEGALAAHAATAVARLAEATALERMARDVLAQEASLPPGPQRVREALRARLRAALAAAPAAPAQRSAWASDLCDRAAAVRTGLDELPPDRAATHLLRVADDVAWHRAQVEPAGGPAARALRRAERRLTAAAQERALEARLLARFGAVRVVRWERSVLAALLTVLALVLVEALVTLAPAAHLLLVALDTLACGVLLTDFAVRLAHVRGRGRWFLRHVWLDLLPSLPLSWLTLAHVGGEPLHAGVGLRVFQLPRFARSLRLLLPLLRLLRVLGFLLRGIDRLARTYAPLLDHDVILHPTRAERTAERRRAGAAAVRARALSGRVEAAWAGLVTEALAPQRGALLALRLPLLAAAPVPARGAAPSAAGGTREVTGEALLERWSAASPEGLRAALPAELIERLAGPLRALAHAPLRWMPFVRRYLPRLAPAMDDAQVVAAAARSAGAELGRHRRRWLWFADLYGTLTPAEFVDRLGTALMRWSFRPAYRITLFGFSYLLISLLVVWVGGSLLRDLLGWVKPVVNSALLVVGGICFAVLGTGWWMRRVASQSTAFYEALSGAQFLELMETLKGRSLGRDAGLFERRVLRPEALLAGEPGAAGARARAQEFGDRVRAWLVEPQGRSGAPSTFDAAGRVALLYRDALDGGLFLESDQRTARQLLGSPTLAALRRRSGRTTRADQKALRWLDFDHPPSTLRGPYLWFSFLAQAVIQTVGRLLADYNRSLLPLSELVSASSEERTRHAAWLRARHGAEAAAGRDERVPQNVVEHASGEFIALHFLDDDPARDAEVQARFGPEVLEHLRSDRRFLVRRIFGTYPLHLRARSERVLNLRRVYEGWFARGRALLLPLWLVLRGLAFAGLLARWAGRALAEVRRPALRAAADEAAQADFVTALRKIDRVRGPLADACLRLRVRADAEYLGLRLLGVPGERDPGAEADADLRFLGGRAALAREVEQERAAARADLARLEDLVAGGLLERAAARLALPPSHFGAEHRRTLALAYRLDVDGVRTLLSASEIVRAVLEAAPATGLAPRCPLWRWGRWRSFRAWWGAHGRGGRGARRQAWRAAAHDVDGAGRALDALRFHGPEGARGQGEVRVAEVLRHPGRLTEGLVTLRAVQTLALLDVLTYREHVYRLGRYAESGDAPGAALALGQPEGPALPTVG